MADMYCFHSAELAPRAPRSPSCIERPAHSSWSHPPRPDAPQQDSDTRFVMILHRDCGTCFAALGRGEDAPWLMQQHLVPLVGRAFSAENS
jgi:hypothetical protein